MSIRQDNRRWRAYLTVNKKQITIGTYDTPEQAKQAVTDYRKANGLPENPILGRPKKEKK